MGHRRQRHGAVDADADRAVGAQRPARKSHASPTTTGCGSSRSTSSACRSACCPNSSSCGSCTGRLQHGWPNTFNRSRVERNARDLYEQAHGGWLVALVAIVVDRRAGGRGTGVPRTAARRGRSRRLNDAVAVVVVAAFFALIHFRWVELPGPFRVRVDPWRVRPAHRPSGDGHRGTHGLQCHRIVAGGANMTAGVTLMATTAWSETMRADMKVWPDD